MLSVVVVLGRAVGNGLSAEAGGGFPFSDVLQNGGRANCPAFFGGGRQTPTLPTNVFINKPVFIQQSLEQPLCQYLWAYTCQMTTAC